MNSPHGVAITADGLQVLAADWGNHRLAVFRLADGCWLRQLSVDVAGLCGSFDVVECEDGGVLVANCAKHTVVKLCAGSGTVLETYGSEGEAPGQFDGPTALVYVRGVGLLARDADNRRVQVLWNTWTGVRLAWIKGVVLASAARTAAARTRGRGKVRCLVCLRMRG